jgi:hypothetical protein
MPLLVIFLGVCPLAVTLTSHAGATSTLQSQPWPAARSGAHAVAYDSKRGLTFLYGDRAADAGTLWAWNGEQWRAFDAPGPGLRRHIKLAFDEARDRLVLYGGYDDAGREIFADTWEWDGRQWQRFDATGPGPRSSYSFVYDPVRRHVLLFGGLSPDGVRNDTWTWDGARWTRVSVEGPSPRGEAGIAFDPAAKRIVLAGGVAYAAKTGANGRVSFSLDRPNMPDDAWAWATGRDWRRSSSIPPAATCCASPGSRRTARCTETQPAGVSPAGA